MATATVTLNSWGRVASTGNTQLNITINANGATYATGTGGLPFDLAGVLIQAAGGQGALNPRDQAYVNPLDIVGFEPLGSSTGGYLPSNFAVGTSTYTTAVGSGYGSAAGLPPAGSSQGFETDQVLATCPCTIRLRGGAASGAALAEVSDGANSDVFTGVLLLATGGVNN
jgi:hypothetical protein